MTALITLVDTFENVELKKDESSFSAGNEYSIIVTSKGAETIFIGDYDTGNMPPDIAEKFYAEKV